METSLDITKTSEEYALGVHRSKRNNTNKHESCVTCHLHIPSRSSLLLGTSNGPLLLWRPKNEFHAEIVRVEVLGHRGHVFRVISYCADPCLVLTCSADHTIKLWDLWGKPHPHPHVSVNAANTGSGEQAGGAAKLIHQKIEGGCVQTMVGHEGSVRDIAVVKGLIISCSMDVSIRVWKSSPDRSMLVYPFFTCVQVVGLTCCPTVMALLNRADAYMIVVADEQGKVAQLLIEHTQSADSTLTLKHSTASNTLTANTKSLGATTIPFNSSSAAWTPHFSLGYPHRLHHLSITHMLFISHENLLLTLSHDHTVQIHDCVDFKGYFGMENPTRHRYTSMEWDKENQELILGDEGGFLQIWNIYIEKCLKNVQLKQQAILDISLSPPNRLLLVTRDGLEVWSLARNVQFNEFKGHTAPIVQLLQVNLHPLSPGSETYLYSCSLDNSMRCWDAYDMSCLSIIKEYQAEITCIAYIPQSILLVSGHDNGTIRLWNIDSGTYLNLKKHNNTISALCFAKTPRTDCLISASFDKTISVWDVTKRRTFNPAPEFSLQVSEEEVLCLCYHSEYHYILTGGNDCCIHIWNFDTHDCVGVLRAHKNAVGCMCLDGNLLMSGSDDTTIIVWDITHHYPLMTLMGHQLAIRDICMVPLHGFIITCSFDGKVIVWDYLKGHSVKQFHHPDKRFRCLLYDAVQRKIFVGTEENRIMFFMLNDELLQPSHVELKDYSTCIDELHAREHELNKFLSPSKPLVSKLSAASIHAPSLTSAPVSAAPTTQRLPSIVANLKEKINQANAMQEHKEHHSAEHNEQSSSNEHTASASVVSAAASHRSHSTSKDVSMPTTAHASVVGTPHTSHSLSPRRAADEQPLVTSTVFDTTTLSSPPVITLVDDSHINQTAITLTLTPSHQQAINQINNNATQGNPESPHSTLATDVGDSSTSFSFPSTTSSSALPPRSVPHSRRTSLTKPIDSNPIHLAQLARRASFSHKTNNSNDNIEQFVNQAGPNLLLTHMSHQVKAGSRRASFVMNFGTALSVDTNQVLAAARADDTSHASTPSFLATPRVQPPSHESQANTSAAASTEHHAHTSRVRLNSRRQSINMSYTPNDIELAVNINIQPVSDVPSQ